MTQAKCTGVYKKHNAKVFLLSGIKDKRPATAGGLQKIPENHVVVYPLPAKKDARPTLAGGLQNAKEDHAVVLALSGK